MLVITFYRDYWNQMLVLIYDFVVVVQFWHWKLHFVSAM